MAFHVSCLPFLRDHDVSVLVCNVLEPGADRLRRRLAVHAVLFAYPVAILDNALLDPLARTYVEEGRDERSPHCIEALTARASAMSMQC